jgi:hypothetical protein
MPAVNSSGRGQQIVHLSKAVRPLEIKVGGVFKPCGGGERDGPYLISRESLFHSE